MGSKKAVLFNQLNLGRDVNRNRGRRLYKRLTRGFSSRTENGQELVEFAIVLPLLLLILYGAIDLGRIFHATITVANAAREGARYIALNPGEIANGMTQAVLEAQGAGIIITTGDVSVDCPDTELPAGSCDRLEPVQVTVNYDFNLLFGSVPGIGNMLDPLFPISRTAEMLVQ